MDITTEKIKRLREQSGAGIMDCRNTLVECDGDMEKALESLKGKGLLKAQKKSERATSQGLVESYIHTAGRIGADDRGDEPQRGVSRRQNPRWSVARERPADLPERGEPARTRSVDRSRGVPRVDDRRCPADEAV